MGELALSFPAISGRWLQVLVPTWSASVYQFMLCWAKP
jgi:hypothetical protein